MICANLLTQPVYMPTHVDILVETAPGHMASEGCMGHRAVYGDTLNSLPLSYEHLPYKRNIDNDENPMISEVRW